MTQTKELERMCTMLTYGNQQRYTSRKVVTVYSHAKGPLTGENSTKIAVWELNFPNLYSIVSCYTRLKVFSTPRKTSKTWTGKALAVISVGFRYRCHQQTILKVISLETYEVVGYVGVADSKL